jgi:hypothetical protein
MPFKGTSSPSSGLSTVHSPSLLVADHAPSLAAAAPGLLLAALNYSQERRRQHELRARDMRQHDYKGTIGSLHLFFGSLGAGAGGLGSYHAMQKPLLAFRLVAYDTLFRTREETLPAVFGCLQ